MDVGVRVREAVTRRGHDFLREGCEVPGHATDVVDKVVT